MSGGAASIVLADDDEDLRAVYAAMLRAEGFEVVEAADGPAAIASVCGRRPDLLILDLWMPGLNGLEVLDRLRHEPAATRTRVVMLSCLGDADYRLESFEAGAVAYLVKGLALEDLVAEVRRVLAAWPADPREMSIADPC
ncbi:MAG TPA: response regulator [Isosphaeraceae bacterium]|jgi:DNA-binding response OmpR family regulator|nr:response regulator [Isosphaeraceae bacterium]